MFLWHKGALKLTVLVVLFLGFLDGVVLQSITGSTVGKYCTRLSVVDEHGKKAHPMRMFGRWVMLVIDLGFLLVGCIITGATHPHRRLGDFVFGTYVVSMSSVGRPIADWIQGSAGRGADNGQSFGEPATWTTPPVPVAAAAPVATAPPTRATSAVLPVQTPPGTTPTSPGEWGAVARPAPLVRSPQWATPPATDNSAPPAVVPAGPAPWAAPPAFREADPATDDEVDAKSDANTDAEPEATVEAEVVDDGETGGGDAKVEDDAKAEPDTEPETATEPEPEAVTETEAEPEVALELEADLGDDEDSTSQWKPVESASKSRTRSADGTKDDSWWDEALSSGDSESESDQVTPD